MAEKKWRPKCMWTYPDGSCVFPAHRRDRCFLVMSSVNKIVNAPDGGIYFTTLDGAIAALEEIGEGPRSIKPEQIIQPRAPMVSTPDTPEDQADDEEGDD